MEIYVVQNGDSLYSIALRYGVSLSQLMADNQLPDPNRLAVGQTIVVRIPEATYTVRPGDTLAAIAQANGTTVRALLRANPALNGREVIYPGQTLVLRYRGEKRGTLSVNGYAYPFIDQPLLRRELPFLTNLTPFTYGFTSEGNLVDLNDEAMLALAEAAGVAPLMHLSTLSKEGNFSNELAHTLLSDPALQERLIESVKNQLRERDYTGLDVDFEYVFPQDAAPYAAFIARLRRELNPLGYPVIVAPCAQNLRRPAGTALRGA